MIFVRDGRRYRVHLHWFLEDNAAELLEQVPIDLLITLDRWAQGNQDDADDPEFIAACNRHGWDWALEISSNPLSDRTFWLGELVGAILNPEMYR